MHLPEQPRRQQVDLRQRQQHQAVETGLIEGGTGATQVGTTVGAAGIGIQEGGRT